MKRKELEDLGLTKEQIDSVMSLNGADVNEAKEKATSAEQNAANLQTQIDEANKRIAAFEGMKPAELQAAVKDWETKYQQLQNDHAAQLLKLEEDGALDKMLTETHKVSDLVAVKAHLNRDAIKYESKSKTFAGLDEQVKPIKEQHGAYFSDYKQPPQIVAGGTPTNLNTDAMTAALRKGAKLPDPQ